MKRIAALLLALCLCISLCACKSIEAKKADELILAIGEVSLNSSGAIQSAQSYYDTLTEEQKAEVENYSVLQSALEALESLERIAAVEECISAIGNVTIDSEPLITAAQAAFNALSEEEQALVSEDSRNTLISAQVAFIEIALSTLSMHWEVAYYVDNFGDETDSAYVRGSFEGTFSNSATSGSELSVIVFYDAQYESISFRLLQYGSHAANWNNYDVSDFTIMLKVDGKEHYGLPSSLLETDIYITGDLYQTISDALLNGSEIAVVIEASKFSTSRYRFTLDGTGFADICEKVQ